MSENIPSDTNETFSATLSDVLTTSGKPANRVILIGAPEWVKGVIYRLHSLGFADVGTWSRLVPTKNPKEMISILQRPRVQE